MEEEVVFVPSGGSKNNIYPGQNYTIWCNTFIILIYQQGH